MIDLNILWVAAICLVLERLYFWVAEKYNIVDKPNHRTLHEAHTVRGGGVIFPVSVLLYALFFGTEDWRFLAGLVLVSVISFIDDLGHVKGLLRFLGQAIALSLVLWQLDFFSLVPLWFITVLIVSAGILNAYNFMDGINGITGGYSLIAVLSLFYLNIFMVEFTSNALLLCIMTGLLIFNFFNFRKNARCFAGDIGSVSIAFIIVFFLLKLIVVTSNPVFILLLAVYGVDSVLTIVHRLLKKENIFEAHRSHLFQVLVYYGKLSHLHVSSIYMIIQLLLNFLVIYSLSQSFSFQIFLSLAILLILSVIYVLLKRYYLNPPVRMN